MDYVLLEESISGKSHSIRDCSCCFLRCYREGSVESESVANERAIHYFNRAREANEIEYRPKAFPNEIRIHSLMQPRGGVKGLLKSKSKPEIRETGIREKY